jgi:hypothetical protein
MIFVHPYFIIFSIKIEWKKIIKFIKINVTDDLPFGIVRLKEK